MGFERLQVQGDSRINIQQVNRECFIELLSRSSSNPFLIQFEHRTLVSKVDISDEVVDVRLIKKTLWTTGTDLILSFPLMNKNCIILLFRNWLNDLLLRLQEKWKILLWPMVTLFRGSGRVLAWAMNKTDAKEELQRVHNFLGGNDISLYKRLQRQWYY